MLKEVFLVFLVLISGVLAENLAPYTSVTSDVTIDGEVDLTYIDDKSTLDYFEATLYFHPLEFVGQEVNNIDLDSGSGETRSDGDKSVNFRWTENKDKLIYSLEAEVTSKNLFRRIDKTIPFPSATYRQEHSDYIESKDYIDITGEIRDQANEIVAGETDYYTAVFKLAEWTRTNIEYDLNTLTEKSVQKSSWVLDNRFGVCDELTNLFTSFLRSLKIPVRYVSGLAHSDVVGGWSPHAWSEVYFPGHGWVPFDVTFGQYGWVDSGHIKMMEGSDANEPSVEYFWRSVKVGIADKEFEVNATLKDKGEKFVPLLNLDVKLLEDNVGEGSYVPIEVTVKNLQPFYVSSLVYVAIAPGLEGDNARGILLKPLQEKKIYWLVKIDDVIQEGFQFTGEIIVEDSLGAKAESEITFAKGFDVISYEEAKKTMDSLEVEEGKIISHDLKLSCDAEKSGYYSYENLNVICEMENNGNVPLSFELCLKKDCKNVNLGITDKGTEVFVYDLDKYKERLFVRALENNFVISDFVDFEIYDKPELTVNSIDYSDVKYSERGEIKINLNAVPNVEKLEILVDNVGAFIFDTVEGEKEIKIPFNGWDFEEGDNFINIKFNYYDSNNEKYEMEKGFTLKIGKANRLERFLVIFRRLFQ
ncbi:MAG: hypothetical protein CMH62_02930 [Nanoarchaeota archaeon]|nr:hypothetical protein [Nanoarchaeota archaeon]